MKWWVFVVIWATHMACWCAGWYFGRRLWEESRRMVEFHDRVVGKPEAR